MVDVVEGFTVKLISVTIMIHAKFITHWLHEEREVVTTLVCIALKMLILTIASILGQQMLIVQHLLVLKCDQALGTAHAKLKWIITAGLLCLFLDFIIFGG